MLSGNLQLLNSVHASKSDFRVGFQNSEVVQLLVRNIGLNNWYLKSQQSIERGIQYTTLCDGNRSAKNFSYN